VTVKRLAVLGATGSIGVQTLDVVRAAPDRYRVVGLSSHSRWPLLFEQAREFHPSRLVLTDPALRDEVQKSGDPLSRQVDWGDPGVEALAADPDVDVVVAAMVGAAGLFGAVKALEAGKNLALANKETLVVGGPLVTELARKNGAALLPIDSEHSAVFQCLQAGRRNEVARVVLTASGGPFRTRRLEDFESITVEEALDHPTWKMGPKITVDSATMMNKALEIIEARWLFDLSADEIGVMIHPQSVVHALVEFIDGSVVAHASPPDMRLPIQYALTYPERTPGPARKLDWAKIHSWEFHPPDFDRFPALELGFRSARVGGTAGAALNAANEAAVAAFLAGEITFPNIVRLCRDVLDHHPYDARPTLERLLDVDRWARQEARAWISQQWRPAYNEARSSFSSSAPSSSSTS
jgi:1-deoxy-D-xylulose-5-phosphate reductoisomerase